uniref:Predicted protein n=1 Tax=Physcomitrium patens TaxID=3218 RepID=A9U520_PHYPA
MWEQREVVFQFYKALTRAVFAPAHTVKVASDICQLRYARKRIESCKEVEQAPANNSINIRQAFNELGASNAFIGVGVTGVSWDPKATVMSWLDHNTFLTTTTCSRHRPCPPRWDSYLRHSGLKVQQDFHILHINEELASKCPFPKCSAHYRSAWVLNKILDGTLSSPPLCPPFLIFSHSPLIALGGARGRKCIREFFVEKATWINGQTMN